MAIQKRHRGGERNTYKPVREVTPTKVTDLTELIVAYFIRRLERSLPNGVTFFYNDSSVIAFEHTSTRAAYLLDFYPLDVELSEAEVEEIKDRVVDLQEAVGIKGILIEQIKNIVDEVDRVKSYHPNSELTVVFGPADTIDYTATTAQPIYMFLVESGDTKSLQTESSFVVLPNDEMSKAYMAD